MTDSYTTDSHGRTTIIERRSGGSGMIVAMIVIIALVAAIAYFLFARDNREQRQSDCAAPTTASDWR